jgi:NifU-like protein involved in Fe-S cluster formation
MLTDLVKGKTVSDIKALQKDDFLKIIGIMLTPARLTCALLAYSSLQKAL